MGSVCKKQGELISLQFEALKKSIIASKKNGERKIHTGKKLDDAIEQKMLSPSFSAYASGFKAVWCNFYCPNNTIGGCDEPYDKPVPEEYDLGIIRDKMAENGRLPIFAEIEAAIRTEVHRNKYFLSQKRGYDVGWEQAEEDYVRVHLTDFLEGTTACFVEVGLKYKKKLEEVLAARESTLSANP